MEGIDIMLIGGYKRRSAHNDEMPEDSTRILPGTIGGSSEISPAKQAKASPPNRSSPEPVQGMRKARPSSVHVKSPQMKPKEDVHVKSEFGMPRKVEERRQTFEQALDRDNVPKVSPRSSHPMTRLSAQQDKENGSHKSEIVSLKPHRISETTTGGQGHERWESAERSPKSLTGEVVSERRSANSLNQWKSDAGTSSHEIPQPDNLTKMREARAAPTTTSDIANISIAAAPGERLASQEVLQTDSTSGVLQRKESFELRAEQKLESPRNDREEDKISKIEPRPESLKLAEPTKEEAEISAKPEAAPSVTSQRRSVLDMVGQLNQLANSADSANLVRCSLSAVTSSSTDLSWRWRYVDNVLKAQGNQIKKTRAEPEFGVALIDCPLQSGRYGSAHSTSDSCWRLNALDRVGDRVCKDKQRPLVWRRSCSP
eukprot:768536-Hanusia_phi.AAC.11